MKSNPIVIYKRDQTKKRSEPNEIKKKIGSLPFELPKPHQFAKIQTKPRSTSKSQQKNVQLSFSKSYLISNRLHQKNNSSERVKSSSNKNKHVKLSNDQLTSILKVDKASNAISKPTHYYSTDKETKRQRPSKSKSYLIDYLNQRHQTSKAESLGKLQKIKKEDKFKTEQTRTVLGQIKIGCRTRQGVMSTNPNKPNQDSFLVSAHSSSGSHLFVVADGHGMHGHLVSQLIANRIQTYFIQKYVKRKVNDIFMNQMFNNIQTELFETKSMNAHTSGSTLITLLVENDCKLTCANVGDSRAILARQIDKKNWEIIHLSEDHKPNLEKQKKRIIKKGGKIHCFKDQYGNSIGPQRVWLPNQNLQGLAMSRSMGDNISKPIGVTHEPQLIHLQLQQRDKFILMGSDGVWQFIKNFQILQLVVPFYKAGKLEQCCDAIMQLAYQRWTVQDDTVIDDITFILIFLNQP